MKNKKLQQILLAHSIPFAAKIIDEFLAKDGVKTYILEKNELEDFGYLIDDLAPDLFMIEQELFNANKEVILSSLQKYPSLAKCIIASGPLTDNDSFKWDFIISTPFEPDELHKQLITQLDY